MGSIDWGAVWEFMWPVLKEGIIALLMALLGYDQVVPSRYVRRHPLEQHFPAEVVERFAEKPKRTSSPRRDAERRAKSDAKPRARGTETKKVKT